MQTHVFPDIDQELFGEISICSTTSADTNIQFIGIIFL